jgi:hypothetical protein
MNLTVPVTEALRLRSPRDCDKPARMNHPVSRLPQPCLLVILLVRQTEEAFAGRSLARLSTSAGSYQPPGKPRLLSKSHRF